MRTTTGAEDNLLALPQRAHWARLWVDRGTGVFVDMRTLEGYNWLHSFSVRDNVDDPTAVAQVRLQRAVENLSLAPLIDGSKLNDGGTLIDVGHELYVEAATMPIGVVPATTDWRELFRGVIDEIDWPGEIMLSCRDLGARLMDNFIINQKVYGSVTGELLEDIFQDILDDATFELETVSANYTWNGTTTVTMSDTSQVAVGDHIAYTEAPFFEIASIVPNASVTILNPASRTIPTGGGAGASLRIPAADRVTLFSVTGDAATPFKVADSPGWALKSFKSGRDHLLPRIRSLAQQIGWECRYRWQNNVGGFRLVLYEPDRTKSAVDWTHAASLYSEPKRLTISRARIRNWVEVTYGRAGARTTTISQDAASIAKYGFLPMAIAESSSSQIDTLTEADKMADAALADLKDPGVEFGVPVPFFWPAQTGDLHRFGADDRRFDSDQDLAVVGVEHSFKEGGGALTNLLTRGKPSGGVKRWLEIEGRPGVASAPDQQGDAAADNVSVTAALGMLVITYDDPRTMDPPIDDWSLTECHVNPGSGSFTPSASTLRGIGRQTRFEIDSLVPGDVYSVILRILDSAGNIGAETTFVAEATQQSGPYHRNQEQEWGVLNENANFGVHTLDETTNPPDHWEPITIFAGDGDWGVSEEWYFDSSASKTKTGDRALKMNAIARPGAGSAFREFRSKYVVVEADALLALEIAWQHDGSGGGNYNAWRPSIEWYTEAKVLISTDAGRDWGIFYLTGSTGVIITPANSWIVDRGFFTAPANAKYARVGMHCEVTSIFAQATHPVVYWDHISLSRTIAKLDARGGFGDRSASSGAWVRPWFETGIAVVIDNEAAFSGGNSGLTIDHQYDVQRDMEAYLFGRTAWTTMGGGATMQCRLTVGGTQLVLGSPYQYNGVGARAAEVSAGPITLSAGDVLRVEGQQGSGINRNLDDNECALRLVQLTNKGSG